MNAAATINLQVPKFERVEIMGRPLLIAVSGADLAPRRVRKLGSHDFLSFASKTQNGFVSFPNCFVAAPRWRVCHLPGRFDVAKKPRGETAGPLHANVISA
jgi:hypothetical protein